jgi:divalent metal cation (Fe/Co/Zn/Cd) transporter
MDNQTLANDNKSIKAVTYLGVAANIILSVLKVLVGTLANSMALVFDGIHSISDIATDVAVLLGVH